MKKKTSKLLAFGIILSMLFAMAVVPASAATSGTCGDNLTWTLDDEGTLTISGTGDMTNYSWASAPPWYSLNSSIRTVIIQSGVTSIADCAFAEFNGGYYRLTSVSIPDSVTSIGREVFYNCRNLTEIEVNENSQTYSSEDGVLFNKKKTTLVAYPNGKSDSYTIPDGVTSIGERAFLHCSDLTSVTISDSVKSIGDYAFYDCINLTGISIPDSVKSIGTGAFGECFNLTSVTIGNGVTSIGDWVFNGCFNLPEIYYSGTETQWNAIEKGSNYSSFYPTIYFNCIGVLSAQNYNGSTISLSDDEILVTGENLNFRNGYVNTGNGYVKAGDKKITGSNIHFTESGKMKLDAGETAKIEKDNGDGTTNQGFIAGVYNPTGIIKMTLSVSGTANGTDYTGRTISKDFDFMAYELGGLVNFGFEVKRVPKPLELSVKSVE